MSTESKLDEILNDVYNAGYDVAGLRAVGESGGTITSDNLYKAKQQILSLITEARIEELKLLARTTAKRESEKETWKDFSYRVSDYLEDRIKSLQAELKGEKK